MEPAAKVDIKSEIYRAAMPHVASVTKGAWARYKELPRGEVFKYFVLLYLLVGFVVSCIAGAIPSMVLHWFSMSSTVIDVAFILLWPIIGFIIGSKDHVVISLGLIFFAAVYISHWRQRARVALLDLEQAKTHLQALQPQNGGLIDVTPGPVTTVLVSHQTAGMA